MIFCKSVIFERSHKIVPSNVAYQPSFHIISVTESNASWYLLKSCTIIHSCECRPCFLGQMGRMVCGGQRRLMAEVGEKSR